MSLVVSRCAHDALGDFVYQENTSEKGDIPWYTTRERRITLLYHIIEIQWLTESMRQTCGSRWESWM